MYCFSFNGGCGVCGLMRIEVLREELVLATDKWLCIVSNLKQFYH